MIVFNNQGFNIVWNNLDYDVCHNAPAPNKLNSLVSFSSELVRPPLHQRWPQTHSESQRRSQVNTSAPPRSANEKGHALPQSPPPRYWAPSQGGIDSWCQRAAISCILRPKPLPAAVLRHISDQIRSGSSGKDSLISTPNYHLPTDYSFLKDKFAFKRTISAISGASWCHWHHGAGCSRHRLCYFSNGINNLWSPCAPCP